jgi:hypothetical protein
MLEEETAVRPWHGERVDRALRCRQGLSSTQRMVLVALADRCVKSAPNRVLKLPVAYFAQLTGFGEKAVNNALKELVRKQLISRHINASYFEPRITYMNWPLITADEEDFKYVPTKGKYKPTEEPIVFPLGDWPEGKQTPSEDVDLPTVELVKPSVPNSKPFIEVQEDDMSDLDSPPPRPKPAPTPVKRKAEHSAVAPAATDTSDTRETFSQMVIRLMPDFPLYKRTEMSDRAEATLAPFNDDEEFRKEVEWTLTTPEAEWYDELHVKSDLPHARIAKCRDIIIRKQAMHLYREKQIAKSTAKPAKRLAYGNPATKDELKAYLKGLDTNDTVAKPARRSAYGNPATAAEIDAYLEGLDAEEAAKEAAAKSPIPVTNTTAQEDEESMRFGAAAKLVAAG